jgi:phage shock protein C
MAVTERLYRSSDDRMLAGVAGGVAEMLDADPSIIRIVWALLVVLTGGLALLVYVVMAVVVPEAPPGHAQASRAGASGAKAGGGTTTAAVADPARPSPGGWVAPDGSVVPMAVGPAGAAPLTGRRVRRGERDRTGGLIAGSILIVIGAFFLLRQLVPSIDLSLWWPAAGIGLGIILVVVAVMPSRRRPG